MGQSGPTAPQFFREDFMARHARGDSQRVLQLFLVITKIDVEGCNWHFSPGAETRSTLLVMLSLSVGG